MVDREKRSTLSPATDFFQPFTRNYIFVLLATFFCTVMMIYIIFVPGDFSCIWRV
jgi:hypothetical protein